MRGINYLPQRRPIGGGGVRRKHVPGGQAHLFIGPRAALAARPISSRSGQYHRKWASAHPRSEKPRHRGERACVGAIVPS